MEPLSSVLVSTCCPPTRLHNYGTAAPVATLSPSPVHLHHTLQRRICQHGSLRSGGVTVACLRSQVAGTFCITDVWRAFHCKLVSPVLKQTYWHKLRGIFNLPFIESDYGFKDAFTFTVNPLIMAGAFIYWAAKSTRPLLEAGLY